MKILLLVLTMLCGSLKASDFDCLTMAIYYEAGNQSAAGKMAVGHVVRNRVEDKRWPASICEVVKQRNQFEFFWDGKREQMPRNDSKMEQWALFEAKAMAVLVYFGFPDITHGALFYHNDKIARPPRWRNFTLTKQLGNHTFYASR